VCEILDGKNKKTASGGMAIERAGAMRGVLKPVCVVAGPERRGGGGVHGAGGAVQAGNLPRWRDAALRACAHQEQRATGRRERGRRDEFLRSLDTSSRGDGHAQMPASFRGQTVRR